VGVDHSDVCSNAMCFVGLRARSSEQQINAFPPDSISMISFSSGHSSWQTGQHSTPRWVKSALNFSNFVSQVRHDAGCIITIAPEESLHVRPRGSEMKPNGVELQAYG
jgi:hypothetical protein